MFLLLIIKSPPFVIGNLWGKPAILILKKNGYFDDIRICYSETIGRKISLWYSFASFMWCFMGILRSYLTQNDMFTRAMFL